MEKGHVQRKMDRKPSHCFPLTSLTSGCILDCFYSLSIRYHVATGTGHSHISSFLLYFQPHLSSRIHWERGVSGRLMSQGPSIDWGANISQAWEDRPVILATQQAETGQVQTEASPGYRETSKLA